MKMTFSQSKRCAGLTPGTHTRVAGEGRNRPFTNMLKRRTLLCVLALLACGPHGEENRGVSRLPSPPPPSSAFDPAQSAALFVGVRDFASAPSFNGVKYTVDDAVDLAYTFALERKVALVPPNRVVLALTDEPVTPKSQERLQKLRNAKATVIGATREQIMASLDTQARLAGREGMLILSFASHGFSRDGIAYILAANSHFNDTASSLSAAKVFGIAETSRAERALIFIDACRERLEASRSPSRSRAASFAEYIKGKIGHVVFYAATPGNPAYEEAGNGVFTKAVIDGLVGCDARTMQGFVTVDKLSEFVELRVRGWIARNRDSRIAKATQVTMDALTKDIPLANCFRPPSPAKVEISDSTIAAFAKDGTALWTYTATDPITAHEIADLDDDRVDEVLITTRNTLTALDALGHTLWNIHCEGLQSFYVERVFSEKRKKQVIAISAGEHDSAISLIDYEGTALAHYAYEGEVQKAIIDRMTARHERKLIVAGSGGKVFLVDLDWESGAPAPFRATLGKGAEVWWGSVGSSVLTKLTVIDHDNDGRRDIALRTPNGRVYINFEGKILSREGEQFQLLASGH